MSAARLACERVEVLLEAFRVAAPAERRGCLELARHALAHPSLAPFCADPLCSLEGVFLSLDAQAHAVEQALAACPREQEQVGCCWGALYWPSLKRATTSRIWVVADWSRQGLWSWPLPESLLSLSPDVESSARTALAAALAVIESSALACPWLSPVPLYFVVEGAQEALGDSLTLPLTLAFLSALTRLPLPSNLGATGTLCQGLVGTVGWLKEKREALQEQGISLLVPAPSASVADLAATALTGGALLRPKEPTISVRAPRVLTPTFLVADLELDPLLWGTKPQEVREILRGFEACAHRAIEAEQGYLYRRRAGGDEGIRAAFAEPRSACRAASALQQALRAHLWPESLPRVQARVGIHRGPAERGEDGYFGPATRLALHLMQAAAPGQVLLTPTVAEALREEADAPTALGLYRLRELAVIVPLFCLEGEGVPRALKIESDEIPLIEVEGIAALAQAMGLVITDDFGAIVPNKKSQHKYS